MSDEGAAFGMGCLLSLVCVSGIAMGVGQCMHDDEQTKWQRQAIEHHAAEWVMDPLNGTTVWRWKQPADPPPTPKAEATP